MRRFALLLCLLASGARAQVPAQWWVGFIDARDRAFLELAPDGTACAERDAAVARAALPAGAVLVSRRAAAGLVPTGARLTFGIADLAGRTGERVMTRVVAIVREGEGSPALLQRPCWYLAEAGAEAPGYLAVEDRLAVGVHPPRALKVRGFDPQWRIIGEPGTPGAVPATDGPASAWKRLEAALPGAAQRHAQPFEAVTDAGAAPRPMWLLGAVARGDAPAAADGTYDTLNLIVAEDVTDAEAAILYQSGPSGGIRRNARGSFVVQVAAAVDLDGDGVDELLVRARHYAGGDLRVLKWNGARYVEARKSGYEGE
jgi:hypothetical protein